MCNMRYVFFFTLFALLVLISKSNVLFDSGLLQKYSKVQTYKYKSNVSLVLSSLG